MGILDLGISIADSVTKNLGFQPVVVHRAWTGQDGYGRATYAAAVNRRAVVDLTRRQRATVSGGIVTVIATVTILETVAPNGAAGRVEPIDPRDILVLPDGRTGPILSGPNAVVNPATGQPFFNEISIGEL
jgi:hypothetical protein